MASNCGVNLLEARITLEYADARTAEAVAKAVSPDNLKTPAGLSVKTTWENSCVVSVVEFGGKMATFIATIDDLLSSASTAEKTLRVVQER